MIDYLYYIDTYEGTKIKSEAEFSKYSKEALLYINSVICEKHTEKDICEAVCALADLLYEHRDSFGIESEKVDGISVTYDRNRLERQMYSILKLYIPSRLLYRGL